MNSLLLNWVAEINTDYLHQSKKDKRHKENYLAFLHSPKRKKDRHKLNFKTRHWVRFLKQENYPLTSLEEIIKDSLSGGCRFSYITLRIGNKNLFFYRSRPTEAYYLEKQKDYLFAHLVWREKEELEELLAKRPYQFRKKWKEIKAKVEILSQWNHPTKLVPGYKENGRPKPTWEGVGWNSPDYWETKNRSLAALAFTHEIVLGKVGTETPLLDLDPNKRDKEGNYKIKQEWLRKSLIEGGKRWKKLINQHQIPYYWKTATPGNSLLPIPYWLIGSIKGRKVYYQGQEIGDLLGQGDLVALPVGGDKKRQLVITEWGRKLVKKYGIEGVLRRKLMDGDASKRTEEFLNMAFLSLDKSVGVKKTGRDFLILHPPLKPSSEGGGRMTIQTQILSKEKTCLKDIWKVFYQDNQQKSGYFLVNDYQRERAFNDLEVGSTLNVCLVQGIKHQFLSRIG